MTTFQFFGPDPDFIRTALNDLDDSDLVLDPAPGSFTLANPGATIATNFTGRDFEYSDAIAGLPDTGTVDGAVFVQDGEVIAEITGAAWPVLDVFNALVGLAELDRVDGLNALLALTDVRFDAQTATKGLDMALLGFSFSTPVIATGSPLTDLLRGGTKADALLGGKGDDTLDGFGGRDSLAGNAGADILNGNGGRDALSGGGGRDILNGGKGKDTLTGGKGQDELQGGKGNDDLTGGRGADVFVYAGDRPEGRDFIRDFGLGGDALVIENPAVNVRIERYDGGDSTLLRIEDFTSIIMEDVPFGSFTVADIVIA